MLNKKSILWVIAALLSITSFAFAQGQEIKEYEVQQGDTLWDISQKELQDPFLWPKVWKENPEIPNPDKLQPGQVIRIPLYLIQKEEKKEEPTAEPIMEKEPLKQAPVQKVEPAPIPARPLVDENLYAASGYIASTVNEMGRIIGSPSGKQLLGTLDTVFVQTRNQVKAGDRFCIIRKGQAVKHPATKASLGHVIEIIGVAEIKKFEYGQTVAQILKTYRDAVIGDILDTYVAMTPPIVSKPYRTPDIQGYVVASRNLRMNNGLFDIVYIDKGKESGLEAGDLLRTVSVGKFKVPNGIVQIINVRDTSSAAVVRESRDSVSIGNLVTKTD
jgi:hypothetical protein